MVGRKLKAYWVRERTDGQRSVREKLVSYTKAFLSVRFNLPGNLSTLGKTETETELAAACSLGDLPGKVNRSRAHSGL